jgi:hypothetical protein
MFSQTQLDRIEEKLDRVINGPESPNVGVVEAMKLTGARSRGALYRRLKLLGVRSYGLGKYSRTEILSAIARATIRANTQPTPQ